MKPESAVLTTNSDRLGQALTACLEAIDCGEADPQPFIDRYPEFADQVKELFAAQAQIDRVISPLLQAILPGTPAESPDAPIPEALGDFRIVREIGRGGMGVVYEAEQLSLRRRVALKVLPFAAVADPRHLQRFKNEALAAAGLDHPHVVRVFAVGSDRGVHYIAMQYINGQSLAEVIRERRGEPPASTPRLPSALDPTFSYAPYVTSATPTHGPTPTAGTTSRRPTDVAYARRVAEWGIQAADALEHAHALGIVHRDVKPANLLVNEQGELFVADFGLAKLGSDPVVTGTGDLIGTPRYMSPEQAGAEHGLVDHRSDVYSLGLSLYEVLTLAPAIAGTGRAEVLRNITSTEPISPRTLARQVPHDLETIVLKSIEKDPADRYPTAKALADDLRRFLEDVPVQARRRTFADRAGRWVRRRPLTLAGSLAVVVIAFGGLVMWDRERTLAAAVARKATADADAIASRTAGDASALYWEGRFREALITARRAVDRLPLDGDLAIGEGVRQVAADCGLMAQLEEAWLGGTILGNEGTRTKYKQEFQPAKKTLVLARKAFLEYGLDLSCDPEGETIARLCGSTDRTGLAAALIQLATMEKDAAVVQRILIIAEQVDPEANGVRSIVRRALASSNKNIVKDALGGIKGDTLYSADLRLLSWYLAFAHLSTNDDAKRVLQEGWAKRPQDFWINHFLGSASMNSSRQSWEAKADALRYLATAAALQPFSPGPLNNYGCALMELHRYEEAASTLRKTIAVYPFLSAYHNLCECLNRAGKTAEFEASCREAIRLYPDTPWFYLMLAEHFGQGPAADSGKLSEVANLLREAIKAQPNPHPLYLGLGIILSKTGRAHESELAFREAIRLHPTEAEYHSQLGRVLDTEGKRIEAEDCYRRALRLNPPPEMASRIFVDIGVFRFNEGRLVEAEAEFRRAIALNPPGHAIAHYNLGAIHEKRNRLAEAEGGYRQALTADPRHAPSCISLCRVLGALDKAEELAVECQRLNDLQPDNPYPHSNLGTYFRKTGQYAESLREYQKCHELCTKQPGWSMPSERWLRDAERLLDFSRKLSEVEAGKLEPANAREACWYGVVAHQPNHYAASARLFALGFALDPSLRASVDSVRYTAACSAALAGCRRGDDAAKLTAAERLNFRQLSLICLTDELKALTALVAQPASRPRVGPSLRRWLQDRELAVVRDELELMKLPAAEHAVWRQLWADVALLLRKVEGDRDNTGPQLEPAPQPRMAGGK